jgi:hypothetical protein
MRVLFVNVSVMWIGGGMGRLFGLTGVIALTSSSFGCWLLVLPAVDVLDDCWGLEPWNTLPPLPLLFVLTLDGISGFFSSAMAEC